MDVKERNKQVKRILKDTFPQATKISVVNGKGTAWGWCDVHIDMPKPFNCHCQPNEPQCSACRDYANEGYRMANRATKDVEFYHYTDDMNSEHAEFLVQFSLL